MKVAFIFIQEVFYQSNISKGHTMTKNVPAWNSKGFY